MASYREAEDLISVGAYQKGSNPKIDRAVALNDRINQYLMQGVFEMTDYKDTVEELIKLSVN